MRKLAGAIVFIVLMHSCAVNNIKEDYSLSKYFNNSAGTFAMFDNGSGEFTIYNIDRYRDSAYVPGSTFNIVTALVGIETGQVKDSVAITPNRDNTGWFRDLATRIGRDTMQHWLDTLGYGQRYSKPVIKDNLDTFWMDNSMKVTPDEQLGLVKKLYFSQLPFQPRSQRLVKNMMLREDNSNYRLSYVRADGWLTGFIEENRHPYFFVLQQQSPQDQSETLKNILRQYGFLEGKR